MSSVSAACFASKLAFRLAGAENWEGAFGRLLPLLPLLPLLSILRPLRATHHLTTYTYSYHPRPGALPPRNSHLPKWRQTASFPSLLGILYSLYILSPFADLLIYLKRSHSTGYPAVILISPRRWDLSPYLQLQGR